LQKTLLASIQYGRCLDAKETLGGGMSKEQTGQKKKKKAPKVRSYVRPTRVHTPKTKKKPKYPDREVEEELESSSPLPSLTARQEIDRLKALLRV
jgi:hypothetical protein